ncbi:MAG TPA: SPFH domain-containing protein, partial [Saprospiraceae bacterium]|nr:SPFH domain-containing protein [Saprospiraceae bacterium]
MNEKVVKPASGYLFLLILLLLLLAALYFLSARQPLIMILPLVVAFLMLSGFFFISPNGSRVLVLFGDYKGTVKENGFYWTNPFYEKKSYSLRARNFDSERIKVNDKRGNPILISVILVWRVRDTFKAAFDVDNYESFVKVQTEAAVRHMAALYSYDNFDDEQQEITLRSSFEEVNAALEKELMERLAIAGIEVMEARIGYLAYAEEIANAMLKRQQAEAIVAARFKIVEGAVGMVEQALDQLSKKEILHLDEDKKATMVSNLMVILCSDREA